MQTENKQSCIVTLLFLFLAFSAGYVLAQSPLAPYRVFGDSAISGQTEADFEPFWEVWQLIHGRYYRQPIDNTDLVEGAINGMLAALDDEHSAYLSPEDQAAAERSFTGEYHGIGAEVTSIDGNITVVSPIDDSPAEAAGVQPGDIFRQVDGIDLTGMDAAEAATLVRGEAGTAVRLLIERDGETFELELIRAVVKLTSAHGEMLDNNIAYVRLSRFADNTDAELEPILAELLPQNPIGLILDLRRNPGGALDTTVDIADRFLDEGVILVEQFGDGSQRFFRADDGDSAETVPLVVLIDQGSASASEVLAGAIQDRERGILIGQTSFGKGTVQTWQPLSNAGGLRLTIAEWLTPNNTSIHQQGLRPDYFIPLPEVEDPEQFEDTQLQAAIDFLLGEPIISLPPESAE